MSRDTIYIISNSIKLTFFFLIMSDASDRHKQPFSGLIISNENPDEIEFDKKKYFHARSAIKNIHTSEH